MLPIKMQETRILKVRKHTHLPFQCNVKAKCPVKKGEMVVKVLISARRSNGVTPFLIKRRAIYD